MDTLISYFNNQLTEEAIITRKMLELAPAEKYDWQPHPKSMSLLRLATHVAEIPGWVKLALEQDELDFAVENYQPEAFTSNKQLLDYFEKNVADAKEALKNASDDILPKRWVMRNGEQLYMDSTKVEVLRMSMSQIIHHRAQLGVFLRLLNIRIPGSYGPSGDEMELINSAQ